MKQQVFTCIQESSLSTVCFSCVGPSTYHTYNFIILKINYNGTKTDYDIQKYEIISVIY